MNSTPPDPSVPRKRLRQYGAKFLFIAACLVTIVAGLWVLEVVRGRNAWNEYRTAAEQRGTRLTLNELIPPPVPDADNFAAIPLFDEIFLAQNENRTAPRRLELPGTAAAPPLNNPERNERIVLAAWQQRFVKDGLIPAAGENAAADILAGLKTYEEPLAQLRQASLRPFCRFPVRWEDGLNTGMPQWGAVRSAARLEALRVSVHLALNRSAEAREDFEASLRLATVTAGEPTLMASLVRISIISSTINSLWGGLAARQWQDEDLAKIETALSRLRLIDDYRLGLNSERAFANTIYDQLATGQPPGVAGNLLEAVQNSSQPAPGPTRKRAAAIGLSLFPWTRQNQLRSNQYVDEILARVQDSPPRIFLERPAPHTPAKSSSTYENMRYMLFRIGMASLESVEYRFAYLLTLTDQARLACALERHRLEHGAFPATLDALVPRYLASLPVDVITGEAFHYRLADDGSFTLYAAAMNAKDDGGATRPAKSARDQPDWVWQYPAK